MIGQNHRMGVVIARYAKGAISLRITKTVTTLKRGKQSTECITRSWLFPGEE